jgi:serine/threonine protein kinase/Tfp pilus assembly protein PilF
MNEHGSNATRIAHRLRVRPPGNDDLRTNEPVRDYRETAEQRTLPGQRDQTPGTKPTVWQAWFAGADMHRDRDRDQDQDRMERDQAHDAGTRSEPPRSGDTASRVRKANVRAALFKKPEPIRIGRFILLERLGAGAMGEIYAAYDEQLDRKVALKLVRSSARDAQRADARLLREAQTLAQLSHPNVVQIYEAGTHAGNVFIAMELIRGKTLTAWLEAAQELPRAERQREILRQFIAAGRGLEAAHGAGLAHRDFKPDNVLVGDDGRVRVVDFGLARAIADTTAASGASAAGPSGAAQPPGPLEQDGRDDILVVATGPTWDGDLPAAPNAPTRPAVAAAPAMPAAPVTPVTPAESGAQRKAALRLTATGMVMGTPRYMAPEQMRGQTPDHRSDQFSFCVALFHALHGEWPFTGANALELMRAAANGKLAVPRNQAEVPAEIRKAVLRGLSAVPADRFADMGELLRVLEARLQRRRRSIWVVAAAALVAGSAAAFAAAGQVPEPCAGVTSAIDALWDDARREALGSVFRGSGQVYADITWGSTERAIDEYVAAWRSGARDACEATHVHQTQSAELLDRRMLCLDRGRQRLDALLTRLDGRTASVDEDLLEKAFEAATALPDLAVCRDAEVMRLSVEPPAEPALARSVAEVRQGLAASRTEVLLGHYTDGLRIAEEQHRRAEALSYPPLRAEALFHVGTALAKVHGTSQDAERAAAILLEAVGIAEGERHDQLAVEIWHELVLLAVQFHSSMERGHAWSQREWPAVQRIGAPDLARAQALQALGRLYGKDARHAEAAEQYRQAAEILKKAAPRSILLASVYHAWAGTEYQRGDYVAARPLFELALELSIALRGDRHPAVARIQNDLGLLLLEIEEIDRARELLDAALTTATQIHGREHSVTGKFLVGLARLEARAGDFQQARAHAEEVRRIYERVYEPEHRYQAEPFQYFGIIDLRQGNFDAAREAFERALTIRRRHVDDRHSLILWTRYYLAESLLGLERHDAALEQCRAVETSTADDVSMGADLRALLLSARGRALLGRGQIEPAIEALEQAVSRFRELPGLSWERAAALWALARALQASGKDTGTRARALAEEARALYAARGPSDARVRDAIGAWLDEHDRP